MAPVPRRTVPWVRGRGPNWVLSLPRERRHQAADLTGKGASNGKTERKFDMVDGNAHERLAIFAIRKNGLASRNRTARLT
ncbi:hypothetical protein GCM10010430_72000 [Kitasatospora cystarginea]|uniref:Transposase n=1 Tax=Kitasatospora cystarginea TaxID=58350 RepID=A0ABN3EX17_9ACTN